MRPYADTNFLIRLYLDLAESDSAVLLAREGNAERDARLPVIWLHRVELCNALQLHLFFGRNPGHVRVTAEQAAAAWASFCEESRASGRLRPSAIPQADLEEQFEDLSLRHTAKHGFRTYDLLHVASALLLKCDTFWSFDAKALRLAKLEGLQLRQ